MKKYIKGNHLIQDKKEELIPLAVVPLLVLGIIAVAAWRVALLLFPFFLCIMAVCGIFLWWMTHEGLYIDGDEVWYKGFRKKRIFPEKVEAILVTRAVRVTHPASIWEIQTDLTGTEGQQLYTMFFLKECMPWCINPAGNDGRMISDYSFSLREYSFCRTVYDPEVIEYFRQRNPMLVVLDEPSGQKGSC